MSGDKYPMLAGLLNPEKIHRPNNAHSAFGPPPSRPPPQPPGFSAASAAAQAKPSDPAAKLRGKLRAIRQQRSQAHGATVPAAPKDPYANDSAPVAPGEPSGLFEIPQPRQYVDPVEAEKLRNIEKGKCWSRIEQLKRRGIPPAFTRAKDMMTASLDELRQEVVRMEAMASRDAKLKKMRFGLYQVTKGSGKLAAKGPQPDWLKYPELDDWHESVADEITDYDDCLERLYDEWFGDGELHPAMELCLLLAASGSAHIDKKRAQKRLEERKEEEELQDKDQPHLKTSRPKRNGAVVGKVLTTPLDGDAPRNTMDELKAENPEAAEKVTVALGKYDAMLDDDDKLAEAMEKAYQPKPDPVAQNNASMDPVSDNAVTVTIAPPKKNKGKGKTKSKT